jgi:superfamily II DNA or RNA helicase
VQIATAFEPRDWQRKAFTAWEHHHHRGIVAVVTGAGKTRLAEICIADFFGGGQRHE